jgi:very-short-patch-repair endonuclease
MGFPGRDQRYGTSSHSTIKFARGLRREQTDAERLLWEMLRNRGLDGLKFRRQHPIGP